MSCTALGSWGRTCSPPVVSPSTPWNCFLGAACVPRLTFLPLSFLLPKKPPGHPCLGDCHHPACCRGPSPSPAGAQLGVFKSREQKPSAASFIWKALSPLPDAEDRRAIPSSSPSLEGYGSAGAPCAKRRTCSGRPKRRLCCRSQPEGDPRPAAAGSGLGAGLRKPREPFSLSLSRCRSHGSGQWGRALGAGGGEEPGKEGTQGPVGPAPAPPPAAGARAAAGRAGACEPASQRAAAAASPARGVTPAFRPAAPPISAPAPQGAGMHHGHAGLPGAVLGRHGPFQQHQLPRAQPAAAVHVSRGPSARHPAGRGPQAAAGAAQGTADRSRLGFLDAAPAAVRAGVGAQRAGCGRRSPLPPPPPRDRRPRADLPPPRWAEGPRASAGWRGISRA